MRIWEEASCIIKMLFWQMAGVSKIVETSVRIAGVPTDSNLASPEYKSGAVQLHRPA
jgi:hypothetical protein